MKFFYLLLILVSSLVFAGEQSGVVSSVVVRQSDGLVYFTLEGNITTGKPSCVKKEYWMIRDENSTAGKFQYSMVLSALSSGKRVSVSGLNTCVRWADDEDVNYICLFKG